MQRSSPLAAALSRTLSHRASTPRPLAPLASSSRLFSSSPPSPARSTANRPKRDPTTYGLPLKVPRKDWPTQDSTDTSHHPLWRFFHDQQPLEAPDKRVDYSSAFPSPVPLGIDPLTARAPPPRPGRPWTAPELRALPFDQLHALWYVLLRERNVLLTQREEARRVRVDLGGFSAVPDKLRMVRLSSPLLSRDLPRFAAPAPQLTEVSRPARAQHSARRAWPASSRSSRSGGTRRSRRPRSSARGATQRVPSGSSRASRATRCGEFVWAWRVQQGPRCWCACCSGACEELDARETRCSSLALLLRPRRYLASAALASSSPRPAARTRSSSSAAPIHQEALGSRGRGNEHSGGLLRRESQEGRHR